MLRDRYFEGVEQIKITVRDTPPPNLHPSAIASSQSWEIAENTMGTLTGIGSDPDNDPLTYLWEQTHGPDAALTNRDMPIAGFTAPEVPEDTDIQFTLTVSDGHLYGTAKIQLRVTGFAGHSRTVIQPPANPTVTGQIIEILQNKENVCSITRNHSYQTAIRFQGIPSRDCKNLDMVVKDNRTDRSNPASHTVPCVHIHAEYGMK